MARIKAHDITDGEEQVEIRTSNRGGQPNVKARREIMKSEEKRSQLAEIITNVRLAVRKPKVKSNAEQVDRIDEYFQMAANRKMPATIEELSLFCGYTSSTINDWKLGKHTPFHDGEEVGITTSDIIKRTIEAMHAIDANLAEIGAINTIAYIFRAKNYYSMVEKQEVTITPNVEQTNMTREQIEQIARNLPDASDSINIEGSVE